MQGKVKHFDEARGFGFISGDEKDIFFHTTNTVGPEPQKGDTVSFDMTEGRKGPEAINVTVIESHQE